MLEAPSSLLERVMNLILNVTPRVPGPNPVVSNTLGRDTYSDTVSVLLGQESNPQSCRSRTLLSFPSESSYPIGPTSRIGRGLST